MITALFNLRLITSVCISTGKVVLIEGDRIIDIVEQDAMPTNANQVDLQGNYLAPGLIDLQIYGCGKPLFFGGNPSAGALAQMEHGLLQQGCTGFLATIATNTNQVVEQGIQAALAYRDKSIGNFLGLHLEGPYLNPARKGAHPASLIKKATIAEVKHWLEMADGLIKMITLAPELQDKKVLTFLDKAGIVLSSGHSDATYQQTKSFLNHPVRAITHLYNAMPPMHHRQPGMIPAIFEQRPYTSIVADGIHVDFAMLALAKRELGEKLFLITDAVAQSSTGVYQHRLKNDHYEMPDGTLSGSSLSMLKAVHNCVQYAGIPLAEAINMASRYPAQLLAPNNLSGRVEKNYSANLIAFNDDFEISTVIFGGNILTKTI